MDQTATVKGEYSTTAPSLKPARGFRLLHSALGYLFAAAGLIWVLHDLHPAQLIGQLQHVNWWWIVAGMLCDVTSYTCQGWRWKLLLRPAGEISALRAVQAVYTGLFVNEVLPMRAGELVRAYLAARWTGATMLTVVPSMVVERLFDGLWMAIGIGLTACFIPLPRDLQATAQALGLVVVLAAALFVWLAFRRPRSVAVSSPQPGWRLWRMIAALPERLSSALSGFGRTRAFYFSFALSLAFLLLQMLAFWMVMIGYGLRASFWIGMVVFLIVHLSTAIPSAPGNAGSYQFFTVIGLTLFGVDKALATGFSLVVFVLLTLPLITVGFLALSRSGMTLHSIRQEIGATMAR
ncbi:MAG TPA: lysylphosphatidylglycerol synthase transmembrane domain-containing protein [Blastocatellia bacterium]|nr:lysylphosphatidylglycerol synthase transmembrane domain-containing protein [Blastocatellia bacterium]